MEEVKLNYRLKCLYACMFSGLAALAFGQDAAPAAGQPPAAAAPPPGPMPLSSPSMTGPLSNQPPSLFDAGPFGKIAANGVLSGFGLLQNNHIPGDDNKQASLNNGQVFIQKTDGWFQFYVQAGAYNITSVGTPYLRTQDTMNVLF